MDKEQARFNMVEQQIRPNNIYDKNLLELLINIKREDFVAAEYKNMAFSDIELPLPAGQRMLSPRIEAMLIQALEIKDTDKILEIGTGSGFVTAILASLAKEVLSLEISELNSNFARQNLTNLLLNNVKILLIDGIDGLAQKAPFDKIFIGGGLTNISNKLKQQLRVGGKLVGFLGTELVMYGVLIERLAEDKYIETKLFETKVDYLINSNKEKFKF